MGLASLRKQYRVVIRDHEEIGKICSRFEKVLAQKQPTLLIRLFRETQDETVALLSDHYAMEENFLFPAIIDGHRGDRELVDDVLALSKEHGIIQEKLNSLLLMVKLTTPHTKSLHKLVYIQTYQAIELIRNHEKFEMTVFQRAGI